MNQNDFRDGRQRLGPAVGRAVAYFLLFYVWQLAATMAYTYSVMPEVLAAGGDFYALYDAVLAHTAEISAVSGLLTLASVVFIMKVRRKSVREEVWLRPVSGRLLGWCAGMAFCVYWLVSLVLSILPESIMGGYYEASAGLADTGFVAVISTAVIAPVVEEVIFRGLIYTRLQRAMRPITAVVLAALAFALCHGQMVWVCYAYVLGLVFTQLTRFTNSILPAMLMHVVFNSTNELMLLFGEWEPGVAGWIIVAAVGVLGSAFCARRVWSLAQEESQQGSAARTETVQAPPVEVPVQMFPAAEVHHEKTNRAMWDKDSGPNHRFPPNHM